MSRTESDPRVALVARALDRAIASPHAMTSGIVANVAGALLDYTWQISGPRFEYDGSEWTAASMRSIVLAFACICPEVEIDELAVEAERLIKWVEWWDEPYGGEHKAHCKGCSECEPQEATVQ